MSEMIDNVARAISRVSSGSAENWRDFVEETRAAIEAMPLEQLIRDAYVRGVEWYEEHPFDRAYRFKASADYADKTLSAALSDPE